MDHTPVITAVDDDLRILNLLRHQLRELGYECLVHSSAQSVLDTVPTQNLGCFLLDLRMPEMDGVQLMKLLRARNHQQPVMMMSGVADLQMAVQSMKAGAFDFIEKPWTIETLKDVLAAALEADRQRCSVHEQASHAINKLALLTNRERQVFNLLADGMLTKNIASKLRISSKTVEVYRSKIMSKLELRSPNQLGSFIAKISNSMPVESSLDDSQILTHAG